MLIRRTLQLLTVAFLVFSVMASVVPKATALSGSEFKAGRIIDDSKFFDGSAMSADEIQRFLNSKVPNCDIWGLQQHSTGPTRASYAAARGISTPFICLKDFRSSTPAKSAEAGLCNGLSASGDDGAAGIIYRIAQSCGISPKVLLVLLQKEQSIVTDDWPWPIQYRSATGYGCPDTAPCDAEYYGFFNQVYMAARQFKYYARDSNSFNYRPASNNYILYNPVSSCGGSTVYIENQATAGLYNYTPYQPNPSAISNLYGSGDSCGAYGNRNFWRMYNDWFGPTIASYDYGRGEVAPPVNAFGNAGVVTLPGNWKGGNKQGFLYMTPNGSGGFDAGVMAPNGNNLDWQGTWWSQKNSAIGLTNTVFIPVTNRSGFSDLYYVTSNDWSKPGFTVGLMANTGTGGFAYQGSQWVASSLTLAKTRFIPGNWTSTDHQSLAYATPNGAGGFDVGVMDPVPGSGLQWNGTWWAQNNNAITTDNTTFIPADSNGDGLSDIYYASTTNWDSPGFSVGLMANTRSHSFSYQGNHWNNTSLKLNSVKFLPGNWTSGSKQGFAYVSRAGTRGFDVSVMDPSPSGLQWQGTWWSAPSLPYLSTAFMPADTTGDGYTDLYYATPAGSGFSLALQHTNVVGGGFTWDGVKWSPSSIPLNTVMALP